MKGKCIQFETKYDLKKQNSVIGFDGTELPGAQASPQDECQSRLPLCLLSKSLSPYELAFREGNDGFFQICYFVHLNWVCNSIYFLLQRHSILGNGFKSLGK